MDQISNITIHRGKLGLAFSGGADSAILLYILLSNTKETLHLYSFFAEHKKLIAEPITERVLQTCIDLTGNNNVVHHKEFIKQQTPALIHGLMFNALRTDGLEKMYTGITKFPPDIIMDSFDENIKVNDPYVYEQRKETQVKSEYFGQSDKFYRPFVNLNKKNIFDLYKQFNRFDLYKLTRSCENINSPHVHCGKCFWCQERAWGFGFLE